MDRLPLLDDVRCVSVNTFNVILSDIIRTNFPAKSSVVSGNDVDPFVTAAD